MITSGLSTLQLITSCSSRHKREPLVTKQTCDWLPQPPNCSQMHSVPTQKHRRNPTSRLSLLAPEFAPPASGTLVSPLLLTTKKKSSPQISSQLEQSFRLSPSDLPPTRAEAETNPEKLSSGMPLSPQPHRYRTRAIRIGSISNLQTQTIKRRQGFLVRELNPLNCLCLFCASGVELRTPKGL